MRRKLGHSVSLFTLAVLLLLGFELTNDTPSVAIGAAWADDGDGGDSGDSDGDDRGDRDDDDQDRDRSGNTGSGRSPAGQVDQFLRNVQRSLFGRSQQRRAPVQTAGRPRQTHAPNEIAVLDLAVGDLTLLQAEGYSVIGTVLLPSLTREVTRLSAPENVTLEAARDRVRALPSGQAADFNHFYRSEQQTASAQPVALQACAHENCQVWKSIGWPRPSIGTDQCAVTVPIGMIDTGINADHEIIAGADLDVLSVGDEALASSKAIHGTAVASVLIGGGRVPGLVREASVTAVDAFARDGSDERADLVSILRGFDLLAQRDVRVINLSLAGPSNRLLENMVQDIVATRGIVLVAAAGNGGPRAEPTFPAGYEGVLAVTAVDAATRIYRRAQRGKHLDIAAPGVNLLAATSVRGARLKTGTSFAVPFVTATVAVLLSVDPTRTPEDVAVWLQQNARDLGAVGPDEVFGHGLLQAQTMCLGQGAQP